MFYFISVIPTLLLYFSRPVASFLPTKNNEYRPFDSTLKSTESRFDSSTDEFLVEVQFEDFVGTETITVRRGETLLNALERAAPQHGWSEVPSDCRRGNCLTCTARHATHSEKHNVEPVTEDGLSPALSINSDPNDEKFFLTCRSTVTGPGVVLRLGQNDLVWKRIYKERFQDESTRHARNAALARVLRKAAEIDPDTWKEKTEALWIQQQKKNDEGNGFLPPESE